MIKRILSEVSEVSIEASGFPAVAVISLSIVGLAHVVKAFLQVLQ